MKCGILFRWSSWWIGAHWSPYNRRLCVNLVPLVTVWFAAGDGIAPTKGMDIWRSDKAEQDDLQRKIAIHNFRADYTLSLKPPLTQHQFEISEKLRHLVKDSIENNVPLAEFKRKARFIIG